MRTLLEIVFIIALTLAVVAGVSRYLSPREEAPEPTATTIFSETESVMETTLAPETTVSTEAPTETAAETTAETELQEQISAVPKYYQTDYPYVPFGNGTLSTSGCSVTCLAMVSTYLTDQVYTPDALAYHFKSFGKNNIERLEHGNAQMQLTSLRTDDVRDVLAALEEGKVVVAMMDDESVFTSTQHFIVLAGLTEEGNIIVHDPLEKTNRGDVYMDNGYSQGFGAHDIMVGFSGAWIYEKVEEPFLFDAALPEEPENRYNGYQPAGNDTYELASFLWAECREEPEEVQQAICEVLLNRVASPAFPNSVHDVIYRSEHYYRTEQMPYADVQMEQYRAVTAAIEGPYILPSDVYYFSIWETSGEVWGKLGSYTFKHTRN